MGWRVTKPCSVSGPACGKTIKVANRFLKGVIASIDGADGHHILEHNVAHQQIGIHLDRMEIIWLCGQKWDNETGECLGA